MKNTQAMVAPETSLHHSVAPLGPVTTAGVPSDGLVMGTGSLRAPWDFGCQCGTALVGLYKFFVDVLTVLQCDAWDPSCSIFTSLNPTLSNRLLWLDGLLDSKHGTTFRHQLVYPPVSSKLTSCFNWRSQAGLEVVAHLSSMGKHQGWQIVSTPLLEPWIGAGKAMCTMCKDMPSLHAPDVISCWDSVISSSQTYVSMCIYLYYLSTWWASLKWFATTHDQYLVWLLNTNPHNSAQN